MATKWMFLERSTKMILAYISVGFYSLFFLLIIIYAIMKLYCYPYKDGRVCKLERMIK